MMVIWAWARITNEEGTIDTEGLEEDERKMS